MQPKKSSYSVEFWDCGKGPIDGHRHTTKLGAERCIAKALRSKATKKPLSFSLSGKSGSDEDAVAAFAMVARGASYVEAGAAFCKSAERVRQIVYKALAITRRHCHQNGVGGIVVSDLRSIRKDPEEAIRLLHAALNARQERQKDPLDGLSTQAKNILLAARVSCREDALAMVIRDDGISELVGAGRATKTEILQWVGIDLISIKKVPHIGRGLRLELMDAHRVHTVGQLRRWVGEHSLQDMNGVGPLKERQIIGWIKDRPT